MSLFFPNLQNIKNPKPVSLVTIFFFSVIFTNQPTGSIWSSSRDVHGYLYLCIYPLPMQFFAWTGAERPLSVDWCGASLPLAWSPKRGEMFRIGHNPSPPPPGKVGMVFSPLKHYTIWSIFTFSFHFYSESFISESRG